MSKMLTITILTICAAANPLYAQETIQRGISSPRTSAYSTHAQAGRGVWVSKQSDLYSTADERRLGR